MHDKYPEHKKIAERQEEHEHVSQFVEWLEEKGFQITGSFIPEQPVYVRSEQVVARYFGISLPALEAEKQQMLKNLRARLQGALPNEGSTCAQC